MSATRSRKGRDKFPRRENGRPYVVVVTSAAPVEVADRFSAVGADLWPEPRKRGFILGGAYNLLRDATPEEIQGAERHHIQKWEEWFPSGGGQSPAWAKDVQPDLWIAYWVSA